MPMLPLSEALPSLNAPTSDKMSLTSSKSAACVYGRRLRQCLHKYSACPTAPQAAKPPAPLTQGSLGSKAASIITPMRNCFILKFFGSFFQERTPP